jgi:PhnB protein
MSFIPFLTFDGTAEEALSFYADVFSATEVQIMRYSDAPAEEKLPPSNRVMYGHIMVGEHCLMAYDSMPGMEFVPQASVAVNHPVATAEEGQKIFDRLAEGGTVTMPYGKVFFAPAFGMVTDRFGTAWMVGVATE